VLNGTNNTHKEKVRLFYVILQNILMNVLSLILRITNSFVYIGLSLSAVSVGGDKYTNFILVALVEIPAYAVTPFFSDRFGRRLSLCVSLLIAGVCCVAFAFIPEGEEINV
jgi:sugar phosphate permease